jgi:hypothetical protein
MSNHIILTNLSFDETQFKIFNKNKKEANNITELIT